MKTLTDDELNKLPSPRLFNVFSKIRAIECKILNEIDYWNLSGSREKNILDRAKSYTEYKLRVKKILDGRKWNKNG